MREVEDPTIHNEAGVMKKNLFPIVTAAALLGFVPLAQAGTCQNASLAGVFIAANANYAEVGRIQFAATGTLTMTGTFVQDGGAIVSYTGSGTFSVNSLCIATATFTSSFGTTSTVRLMLHTVDAATTTNVTYGASGIISSNGQGASVELRRLGGKF